MKLDSIDDWVRTCYSVNVTPFMDGKEVTLFGWVQEIRDLGGIRFVILQDREGTIQVTVPRKKVSPEVLSKSDALQKRYSVGVKGIVKKTTMSPRGVEVAPKEIKILSTAAIQLPIDITGKTPANIEVLRRKSIRPLPRTEHCSIQNSTPRPRGNSEFSLRKGFFGGSHTQNNRLSNRRRRSIVHSGLLRRKSVSRPESTVVQRAVSDEP